MKITVVEKNLSGYWIETWESLSGERIFILTNDGKKGRIVSHHIVFKEEFKKEEDKEISIHMGRS